MQRVMIELPDDLAQQVGPYQGFVALCGMC